MTGQKGEDNPNKEPYLRRQLARFREALAKVQSEQTKAKTRDEQYKNAQLGLNRKMVIFTGVLAACSVAAGGVSIWQGWLLRYSNKTNRDALHSVQRAFIFTDTGTPIVLGSEQKATAVIFPIMFENSGTTPTKGMTAHITYRPFPGELPDTFDFYDAWASGAEHVNTPTAVGAKGKVSINTEPIPLAIVEAAEKRELHFYVWGWARYHDVFDGTPEHVTKFCYELVPRKMPPTVAGMTHLNISSPQCKQHNCYDDDCKKP